ncbi:hypothetical protein MJ575_22870 [Klebsiella pneumoniae]|nr:hypothetical protein MJ575_22870 [Klebsiella pneumoniae]
MQSIYAFVPQRVVVDAHPGYRSTQWAVFLPLPLETVLHHHAHAAACLAEHRWPPTGGTLTPRHRRYWHGENGALWGVCLRVNYRECEHLGGCRRRAARGTWRHASRGERLAHRLALVLTGRMTRQAADLAPA